MSRSRRRPVFAVAIGFVLIAAACTGGSSSTTTTAPASSTSPTTTSRPAATTQPRLTAVDVFRSVSPSIAFLETPAGTGSGVLIDSSTLVTNAHVVWPYDQVRVVFGDGAEIRAAPVIGVDLVADLALVDVSVGGSVPSPPTWGDGTALPIGSRVFLVGFPAETDDFPTATISEGILGRFRTWEAADLVYLQTDALIAAGQSGGALVDDQGFVVGISGFSFSEGFALVAEAGAVVDRIAKVRTGEAPLADRAVTVGRGDREVEATLVHFADEASYVVHVPAGTPVDVEVSGDGDVAVQVLAPDGFIEAQSDEPGEVSEIVSFVTSIDGPHFIAVRSLEPRPVSVRLTSSAPLLRQVDPDDAVALATGLTYIGGLDYPGDTDYFTIRLAAGEQVRITVDSPNFDPQVFVDRPDNSGEPLGFDDDSGGGLFGWNASVVFRADDDGLYLVVVSPFEGEIADTAGGYILTVG